MQEHIFLPTLQLGQSPLLPEHEAWLVTWLQELEETAEKGDIASSLCLQATIAEIALHGRPQTDWVGIMDAYLVRDKMPIAYSEEYGKRLYKFAHWIQTDVHAIHARWWVEKACSVAPGFNYNELIESLIQPSGWIYNPGVSPTGLRTRMKSEYQMSLAMGIEILTSNGELKDKKEIFEGLLSSENVTGYLSAEYFRLHALKTLNAAHLAPKAMDSVVIACEVGKGYCDFDVKAKIDDYMGTAKRVGRDVPVHSAISALHAGSLSLLCSDPVRESVVIRIKDFGNYLVTHPLDIQAFRMREIDIPFGTGLSPLEIIAASAITKK